MCYDLIHSPLCKMLVCVHTYAYYDLQCTSWIKSLNPASQSQNHFDDASLEVPNHRMLLEGSESVFPLPESYLHGSI